MTRALTRARRRVSQILTPVLRWIEAVSDNLGHQWKRSLQLRVVVSTLTLSVIVIAILGVVLTSQITERLLDTKLAAAQEELERARVTLGTDGASDIDGQAARLEAVRQTITSANPNARRASGPAGTFEPVLIMPGPGPQPPVTAGPASQIPQRLREYVRPGQVAYQYATVNERDGYRGPALIIGAPATGSTLELYLIFPLASEQSSLALMRGTMVIGGGVLLFLLAAIAWLVARQVVLPIRAASRIAVRFADGRLKERMPVRGEDEIARLALSFNEMAEGLSKQIHTLEEFGNLQRQFTSDVSHELLTPLSTIRMAADLLYESRDELEGPLGRSAALLKDRVDHFELLLAELLEISRHDAGMAVLASEQIDVRVSVTAAIETVQHLAGATGSKFVVDMPDEPVLADIDSRRVQRILRNLLGNAFDHGEGKPIVLRLRADDNAVAITVRDQGVGLRPGEEKLVFNRFWRADESRVRTTGGTGLGLAISAEDAALHDGKLEAWGEPGAGSCFRLTLPRKRGRKIIGSPLPLRPPSRRAARTSEADRDTEPVVLLDPAEAPPPGGASVDPTSGDSTGPVAAGSPDTKEPTS